jgi:hypothetical protein
MGWLFAPTTSGWREAVASKVYYSVYRWTWYEWLGALAPLFLFWVLWRFARQGVQRPYAGAEAHDHSAALAARLKSCPVTKPCRTGEDAVRSAACETRLARFALAVFAYGVFQQVVAMALLGPEALMRLTPFQPMRYLHLVYIFMALLAGGLLGRFVLKTKVWRWAIYLLVINGGMFLVQWEQIDDGVHLELPFMATANPWLQAFDWIRRNTPADAYFALDPRYLAAPGEGFHSFRALAERSQLADGIKDTAVVMQVPSLAPTWHEQQLAQAGWNRFEIGDFERLKTQFGVDWVLVAYPQPPGLDCRWHNNALAACRVP